MILVVGVHAAQHAELVGMPARFGQQFDDAQSAFATSLKLPARTEQLRVQRPSGLSMIGRELRFFIKRLDVRRSAAHAEEDDPLRPCSEVRPLESQRPIGLGSHRRERDVTEPGGDGLEKRTTSECLHWRSLYQKSENNLTEK